MISRARSLTPKVCLFHTLVVSKSHTHDVYQATWWQMVSKVLPYLACSETDGPTAPAVPVHLGAMAYCVQYQLNYWKGNLKRGDVLVSNHPQAGGSHLPARIMLLKQQARSTLTAISTGHHCCYSCIQGGHRRRDHFLGGVERTSWYNIRHTSYFSRYSRRRLGDIGGLDGNSMPPNSAVSSSTTFCRNGLF